MEEPKRRARRIQAQMMSEQASPEQPLPEQPSPDSPPEWEAAGQQEIPASHRKRPCPQEAGRTENPRRKRRNKAARSVAEGMLFLVVPFDGGRKAAAAALAKLRLPERLALKKLPVRETAMLLLIGVMLFSGWQVGSIALRSARTARLNKQLSSERAELISQQDQAADEEALQAAVLQTAALEMAASETAGPAATMAPVKTAAPEAEDAPAAKPEATAAPDVVTSTRYHQMGGEALAEMAALREKNTDLVAWVQIPDVLDLPVVYRDNSYYLNRDFNRQKNASGTIFLDENHPFREKTQNLLLHGHNMKDGTMFGRLAQYLYDDTYLRNHPFIYFDTLWKKEQYVIFAVLDVSLDTKSERFFNYFTHSTFRSDAEFSAYIRQLQLRSGYAIPIDVQPGDALLTLSTCLDDDRLVIVARRLREHETRSQLRELIRMTVRQ